METDFVPVGKGMWRVTIKSRALRDRFVDQPGFRVSGDSVYFHETLLGAMKKMLGEEPRPRRHETPARQMELFA